MALRFFVGILGGSFVPCQVWSTGFFDKNIVGTANSFTGGFGNAGGGITYFLMPAIYDSLVKNQHLTAHVAWRVAFIVPFIIITFTAIAMLICCPDTPTGKWSERHLAAQHNLQSHGITGDVVDIPGEFTDKKSHSPGSESPSHESTQGKMVFDATGKTAGTFDHEAQIGEQAMLETARGEIVVKPTFKEAMTVILSLQTLVTAGCYFCSFGTELAVNSILGAYYIKNFPKLGQTGTGNWAAMFGLLNIVFRPLGGMTSDFIYRKTNVWGKKYLIHFCAIITGAFLIAIGLTDSHQKSTMFGLIAGMALFLEAGNGANYSLVPHVHPHANGMLPLTFFHLAKLPANHFFKASYRDAPALPVILVVLSLPLFLDIMGRTTARCSGSLVSLPLLSIWRSAGSGPSPRVRLVVIRKIVVWGVVVVYLICVHDLGSSIITCNILVASIAMFRAI